MPLTAAADTASPAIRALLTPPAKGTSDAARNWATILVSVVMLAAVVINTRGVDFGKIMAVAPGWSWFWPAFALFYLIVPVTHWMIYRGIWQLPIGGIVPLLRKQVANEIVLGYSGEAQFYLWARRHLGLSGSPFGAIKDVSVLSAVAGNIATLGLMIAMAPTLSTLMKGPLAVTAELSVGIIVVCSLVPFLFRRRLFSLKAPELRTVFAIHTGRIIVSLLLSAAMWHFLLPGIAVGTWFALSTLRMMISRLPLIANKDILFAAATMLLLGKDADVSAAITFTASLTLVAHLAVGAATGAAGFIERRNQA